MRTRVHNSGKRLPCCKGETPTQPEVFNCTQISPEIGITNTPVIDRSKGPRGAIYFVAMSTDANNVYHQRLHALDLVTGAELFGGPVEIQAQVSRDRGQ